MFSDYPQSHRSWGRINGAGVESISAKWKEMFGVKEEFVLEEVKAKKPLRKTVKLTREVES
jgi:hypothetical protein